MHHFNYSAILFIILGVLFLKVFPGMIGDGEASDVISTVFRIVGIILIVIGAFNFVTSFL